MMIFKESAVVNPAFPIRAGASVPLAEVHVQVSQFQSPSSFILVLAKRQQMV